MFLAYITLVNVRYRLEVDSVRYGLGRQSVAQLMELKPRKADFLTERAPPAAEVD